MKTIKVQLFHLYITKTIDAVTMTTSISANHPKYIASQIDEIDARALLKA